MKHKIIGREKEMDILQKLLTSSNAELLAVYGRRRVGKTFLIRNFYDDHIAFTCSGQLNGTTAQQLLNFQEQLSAYFPKNKSQSAPQNWQDAFRQLRANLDRIKTQEKKVIFFDELPWLDTHKSGFLSAFGYFWNTYASERNDFLVVICGSAASWIIKKIVNNKGGLHNRITQRIRLLPFTLKETKAYLEHRNIRLNNYQVIQLYMVMGGIPHYLNAIERGRSVQQNIEKICFDKDGALAGEFQNLYAALFSSAERHVEVIQALSKKNKGLTRNELLAAGKFITGGGLTEVLNELLESGFIEKLFPYNKKTKDSLFQLSDEFSLFYFRFMHGAQRKKSDWLTEKSPAYTIWCGYAFENICLKHIHEIKTALGISGMKSNQSSWHYQGNVEQDGAQIDLLIERSDQCINICEMKFSNKTFSIDKKYAADLQRKLMVFRNGASPKETLFLTFVTTYGVAANDYKTQLVDGEVTMDAFF